jgi:hypothetical protein
VPIRTDIESPRVSETPPPLATPIDPAPATPLVSAEGWARFEQRTRDRRVARRLAAARDALLTHQYQDAEAALDEVEELSPNESELASLRNQLLAAREIRAPRGRWFAAAIATVAVLLLAMQVERHFRVVGTAVRESGTTVTPGKVAQAVPSERPESRLPTVPPANAVAAAAEATGSRNAAADAAPSAVEAQVSKRTFDAALASPQRVDSVAAANTSEAAPVVVPPQIPLAPVATVGSRTELPAKPIPDGASNSPATVVLNAPDVRTLPIPTTATPVQGLPTVERPAPPERATLTERQTPNDEQQVRQVLQRYRQAYGTLNARSAQDVWPGVDAAALARAFDALESQELTFDDCRIAVTGSEAMATCHGSARFVPKVGGRAARTEARVWDFRLRKTAAGWQIASARVAR